MRSQLDSAQQTMLQMCNECNDLRMEMSRAIPAHAAAVKVCHTSPMSWHTLPWPSQEEMCLHLFMALQVHLPCCLGFAIYRIVMHDQAHKAECMS